MPTPRRILPSDRLETGFRGAHNDTVDAIPHSAVVVGGKLQFKNDEGVLIWETDLGAIFKLKSESDSGNTTPGPLPDASETETGGGQIATYQDYLERNQFKWLTPDLLAHILENRPSDGLIGRFDLHTENYDEDTLELKVSVEAHVQPQLLLEETGASSVWVAATAVAGSSTRWTATFYNVLYSGRIRVKAADDDLGAGHSMSLIIPGVQAPPIVAEEN